MLRRRCANVSYPFVLGGLLILTSLEVRQLSAQRVVQAQSDSPRQSSARPLRKAAAGTSAAREAFRQHCAKCHGADGSGSPARSLYPDIPDFAAAAWQARRSDAQLLASILDGKGPDMPAWRTKISKEQAQGLVVHVRAYSPTKEKPGPKKQEEPTSPSDFEKEFRRLQEELSELQRKVREPPKGSADREPSKPSESFPRSPTSKQSESSPRPACSQPSTSTAAAPAGRELFRQHCEKCHGKHGTGKPERGRLPEIPNFTDSAWQGRRTDAQLVASILDGKGKKMPPWRAKISEEQARGLAAYVRAFAPTTGRPGEKQEQDERLGPEVPGERVTRHGVEHHIGNDREGRDDDAVQEIAGERNVVPDVDVIERMR